MSFCVSHRRALDKNLKHLYSGLPHPVVLRASSGVLDGSLDLMDRVMERHKRPPERFEAKFQEYLPQYSARLPRAPAFRHVSPEQAREISERLSRPTFMSAIRRQSAVSRGATERAESRRCGSRTTSRALSNEREESSRKRKEPTSGHPSRKISYQDWTDEESGAYYYEDEESSIVESSNETKESLKNDKNTRSQERENHVIDFGAAPRVKQEERERSRSEDKTNSWKHPTSSHNREKMDGSQCSSELKRQSSRSRSSSSSDSFSFRENHDGSQQTHDMAIRGMYCEEQSTETVKETSFNKTLSSASVSTAGVRKTEISRSQPTKANLSRKKFSLLEQIMQARTPQQKGKRASIKPNTGSSNVSQGHQKHLYKREQLDTRLRHSPYCDPMPQLFIVYTPVAHSNTNRKRYYGNHRGKSSETWTSSRERARLNVSSAGVTTTSGVGGQRKLEQRPFTRQSERTTKHNSPARRTVVASRNSRSTDPSRSKSAPPDQTELCTHTLKTSAAKRKRFSGERETNGSETRTNQNKECVTQLYTGEHQEATSSQDRQDLLAVYTDSTRDREATRSEPGVSHSRETNGDCGGANHPHLWYEHDEVRHRHRDRALYGNRNDERHRSFASPEEMSRANKRLQKPTKVKLIRDRMRWAPNNDHDLADPVRVIREVTGDHEEFNWKRKKGDDVRGNVDGESAAHDGSSSEDSSEDDESVRVEREKQETIAHNSRLRQKTLKNKKDAWVRKGVIQPRKNLSTTKPQSLSKSQLQKMSRQREIHGSRSRPKVAPGKGQGQETSPQKCEGQSFPRPHLRRSRSSSPTPRSRSSSKASSKSSKDTMKSKSTVKSRSHSRSNSRSRSRSNSRSRSRSSSCSSRSRSRSKSKSKSESSTKSRSRSRSKSRSRSRSRSRSSSESRCNSTTLQRNKDGVPRAEREFTNSLEERSMSPQLDRDLQSSGGHASKEKHLEKISENSGDNSSSLQRRDDAQGQGHVREFDTTERKTAETPECDGNNKASYSVGLETRGGRGDEYHDGFGRGYEDARTGLGCTATEPELDLQQTGYSHSRQTRGTHKESFRSEEGDEKIQSSSLDKDDPVRYSVTGEMYTTNLDTAAQTSNSNNATSEANKELEVSKPSSTRGLYLHSPATADCSQNALEHRSDCSQNALEPRRSDNREESDNCLYKHTDEIGEERSQHLPEDNIRRTITDFT